MEWKGSQGQGRVAWGIQLPGSLILPWISGNKKSTELQQMMSILSSFEKIYGRPPAVETRAPGRVNLLGEHVDYKQGIVLPVAIDQKLHLVAAPTTDEIATLDALDLREKASFRLEDASSRGDLDGRPLPGWALYPAVVAWALQQAGLPLRGMRVVYTSDIPIGAGLSSSAAVEGAFAITWPAVSGR